MAGRASRDRPPRVTRGPEDPTQLDFHAAPRVAQALRLRRLGYSYAEVAARAGYRTEQAAVMAVRRAQRALVRDEARDLVARQSDLLDQALQVVMRRILADDEHSLWAVDRLVPLLKREADLLGLDAPAPTQATVAPPMIIEIPAALAQALRATPPALGSLDAPAPSAGGTAGGTDEVPQ